MYAYLNTTFEKSIKVCSGDYDRYSIYGSGSESHHNSHLVR